MPCTRPEREKTPTRTRRGVINLVSLAPVAESLLPEHRAIHALLGALGRIAGATPRAGLPGGHEGVSWSDHDYAYFDMDMPDGKADDIDLSVANGRLFLRVARSGRRE
jgi:hypothetical protein